MIEIIGPSTHGAVTPSGKPLPLRKQLLERLPAVGLLVQMVREVAGGKDRDRRRRGAGV